MFEQAFKNIDDVLWKGAGCTCELDHTEQTSGLLALTHVDALDQNEGTKAALSGKGRDPNIYQTHRQRQGSLITAVSATESLPAA